MKTIIFAILTILFLTGTESKSQDFIKITNSVVSIDSGASRSVNWIDYDNDNDLDLFISTGYRYGDDNLLYRNDNGTFVRIFNQPLVEDSLPSDGSSWGDYDNDGLPDLCVVNWWNKINLLYKNIGDGNFTFQNTSIVCTQQSYSETCSWGDYDNDGLLDLFVTNSDGTNHRNIIYKNTGAGNFVKIDTGVVTSQTAYSRGMNWVDIDNDRDLDIFVCREGNQNEFLYRNNGNGYFTAVTNTSLTANGGESWSGSWGDYDNDGDLDVFITNNVNQKNSLFRNDGNFSFTKINNDPIVNENGYNAVSGWGDYDNDGDLDMFVTQAYVPPDFTMKLVNKLYKNMLRETGTASFEKITWGDYDNDGDLDIVTANTFNENQKNALYKNELSNGNKWINIKCKGSVSNKSAIGTKVRVKAIISGTAVWQMQEIDGQSGYCGQNLILHFGFGNASVIDSVKVEWSDGGNQYFTNVSVNQNVTITENGNLNSIGETKPKISKDYVLNQNYPNPFNPATVISYQLTVSNFVSLKVFNNLGNEVAMLVNQKQNAGSYEVVFNAGNFASGVYFYRLEAGEYRDIKRMVLIK